MGGESVRRRSLGALGSDGPAGERAAWSGTFRRCRSADAKIYGQEADEGRLSRLLWRVQTTTDARSLGVFHSRTCSSAGAWTRRGVIRDRYGLINEFEKRVNRQRNNHPEGHAAHQPRMSKSPALPAGTGELEVRTRACCEGASYS
jgi:hypothetical protein